MIIRLIFYNDKVPILYLYNFKEVIPNRYQAYQIAFGISIYMCCEIIIKLRVHLKTPTSELLRT